MTAARTERSQPGAESMFDRFYWLYAFCREHVFRDDTDLIIGALWPNGRPAAEGLLLELGCGPGFYACRLADRFDGLHVLGIDLSERQIRRAQARASLRRLGNCRFEKGNALSLKQPTGSVNAVVASRLFTILPNASAALGEYTECLSPAAGASLRSLGRRCERRYRSRLCGC
ncbi:MAG: methyltransferase domain-containing protein [Chloroflexia bacterium]